MTATYDLGTLAMVENVIIRHNEAQLALDGNVFNRPELVKEAEKVFKNVNTAVRDLTNVNKRAICGDVDIATGVMSGVMFIGKANLIFTDLKTEHENGTLALKIKETMAHAVQMEIYSCTLSDATALYVLREALLKHFGVFNDVPF